MPVAYTLAPCVCLCSEITPSHPLNFTDNFFCWHHQKCLTSHMHLPTFLQIYALVFHQFLLHAYVYVCVYNIHLFPNIACWVPIMLLVCMFLGLTIGQPTRRQSVFPFLQLLVACTSSSRGNIGSYTGLELAQWERLWASQQILGILQSPLPQRWDSRYVPPRIVYLGLGIELARQGFPGSTSLTEPLP